MQTVTTIAQLLPLVAEAKTCKEFGAIIMRHVPNKPRGLKRQLALAARDTLGRQWTDSYVQIWLQPSNHTEKRKQLCDEAKRRRQAEKSQPARERRKEAYLKSVADNLQNEQQKAANEVGKVKTLDGLLPLVSCAKTCREFGAIIIENVPQHLKGQLARAARDALNFKWSDTTLNQWLSPKRHSFESLSKNLESVRAFQAKPENKESLKERAREYRNDPEMRLKLNERRMAWHYSDKGQEWSSQPHIRIRANLGGRLWAAVKAGAASKAASTMELTGCDLPDLMRHLEGKFSEGMTWQNYGEWHIDHIRPCASFDLTDPEQQRQCFHWTNLQPLWGADNMSKGDKLDWSPSPKAEPDWSPEP